MFITFGLLMFLQAFRVSSLGFLDKFFMNITIFGNSANALFLIGVIYWAFDKKLGEYLLVSFSFSRILDAFAKLTACIYRPWVLNPDIVPYEDAMEAATGYSFPSGHTLSSTILFFGSYLKGNLTKGLKIICILAIVMIGLSRCYLGVHTEFDVLFGFLFGAALLIVIKKIFDRYEDNPNFDLIIMSIGIVLSIVMVIYVTFKSYPMDYDNAGKLIVDPAEMVLEGYKDAGYSLGILVPWVIERRFVGFSHEGTFQSKILRVVSAYAGFIVVTQIAKPLIKLAFSPEIAQFVYYFIFSAYIVLIVPVFIKFFQNRRRKGSGLAE